MPTNSSLSFIITLSLFPLGASLAFKYAPGIAYVPISLPSWALISNVAIRDSRDAVGEATNSSCLMYILYLLPSTQYLPFMTPFHFSFMRFTSGRSFFFSMSVKVLASVVIITGLSGTTPSFNYENSFIMAATAGSPYFLTQIWSSSE